MVYDKCGVIERLCREIIEKPDLEHCALAIADAKTTRHEINHFLIDYCMLEDVGGKTTDSFTSIPREVSFSLLRHCKRANKVPVVLHTHVMGYEYSDPLGFSPQDMQFISRFTRFAKETFSLSDSLFIVMNGNSIVYCWEDDSNSILQFGGEL